MKRRSFIGVMALTLVLVLALSACGAAGANTDVLRVGVDDSYPPMEFKDANGKDTVGFDVDVAKELAKRLGKKEVKHISNDWAGIFDALETDKFDVIISSVSITDERKEKHSLTDAYIANKQVIVTKKDNDKVAKPEDLKNVNVGCQQGTTSESFCTDELKLSADKFKTYPNVTQPFDDLSAGRLDAVVVDIVVAKYYLANNKDTYKVAWESDVAEPMAFCFKKKDGELRDKVNKILGEMQTDGTMKTISEKWFGEDVTSNLK
jgi:polar amino acid transport system substrate-binding protein